MRTTSLRTGIADAIGALVLALLLGQAAAVADTIRVGAPIPQTGPFASDGSVMQKAIPLAVDDINKAGGLLGQQLEVVWFDIGDLTPDKLQASAANLIDRQKADFIVTGYGGFGPDIPAFCPQGVPYVHADGVTSLIAIDANFVWWMMLEPMAIDRTNGRWGCSYSPKAMAGMKDPEKYVAAINETVRIANEEDKAVTARVQQGVAFGAREQGFLHSRLEIYVDEFRRYVERMTG
jgi:hypothetical protein